MPPKKADSSTTFTLSIPATEDLPRPCLLTAQRGSVGTLHRFRFSSLDEVLDEMAAASARLESLPETIPAAPAGKGTVSREAPPTQEDGPPALVLTLTLPPEDDPAQTGTITARRDGLGTLQRFRYEGIPALGEVLGKAYADLLHIEAAPPLYQPDPVEPREGEAEQVSVTLYGPEGPPPADLSDDIQPPLF
jgi:hypothetical protein